jgi:eukaryotic translation initiation factor 2C
MSPRSTINIKGFSCQVDLGADEGRPNRKNNVVTFEIKQTCKVRMEALKAYLDKRMAWDNTVLECISK